MSANLFATTTTTPKTAKGKTEKKTILVSKLSGKVGEFLKAKQDEETAKAKKETLASEIKEEGVKLFLNEYKVDKKVPENFNISDNKNNKVLFIVNDKYTTVTEEKAILIKEIDKQNLAALKKAKQEFKHIPLLETVKTYTMDAKLVEKYATILSKLILECDEIEADDKTNLIKGTETYVVAKGAVNRLMDYGKDMPNVFDVISPIVALKA